MIRALVEVGTRIGPYEILAALGAGAMGEVYQAHDSRLARSVAIKILPQAFASDPERLARFEAEAKALAALNHPHIAQIYGLEGIGTGGHALVMELVVGDDLSERIAHGPIPVREALLIAKQIADAIESAHEQGIIHRDLKPANVRVRHDGTVKVLDFGIAKAMEPGRVGDPDGSALPTMTRPAMTQVGLVLGTAPYMSPEQAKGRPADRRSDVWAFGCVLYEMLTGTRAFGGEDVADMLAFVLTREPDWTLLPADTPVLIRRLLRRCLEKDRKRRLADAADVRLDIEEALAAPAADGVAAQAPAAPRGLSLGMSVAVLLVLVAAASLTTWVLTRTTPPTMHPVRFAVVLPSAQPLNIVGTDRDLAVSPDGTHLVYVSSGGQLMVRALDQLDAVPLQGITGARSPFFSPDGRWVGMFTGASGFGGELKKVSIAGGPPLSLCRYLGAPRGASWGANDTIVFATNDSSTGLLSVPSAGGEPTVLTTPDAAHGEQDHLFPLVLPGGKAVVFTSLKVDPANPAELVVLDLPTGQRKTLVRVGSQAEYIETGHLVYAAAGTLRAVRFDPAKLQVLSEPVPVVEQVMALGTGAAQFSVSRLGALAYVPGGGLSGAVRSLVWVNRHGEEESIAAPPRAYTYPRLSPDGTRVVLYIRDQDLDLWIWDLAPQTLTRLTDTPDIDVDPVWTPDGRRIIFGSARAGTPNLFWQAADTTGTVERLTTSPNAQFPSSISADGTRLIVGESGPKLREGLRVLRLDGLSTRRVNAGTSPAAGLGQTEALMPTTFANENGEISPDGHWLAYQSNTSGQSQIFVRPFPNVEDGQWTISSNGGTRPAWARNSRELFYLDATNAMMAVPVHTTPTFSSGIPTKLFEGRYFAQAAGRSYDLSPNGERFLMIKDSTSAAQNSSRSGMVFVLNWADELKRLLPAK